MTKLINSRKHSQTKNENEAIYHKTKNEYLKLFSFRKYSKIKDYLKNELLQNEYVQYPPGQYLKQQKEVYFRSVKAEVLPPSFDNRACVP